MHKRRIMALEAINFQDTGFFDEMTQSVEKVMSLPTPERTNRQMSQFFKSKEMLDILKVIKKHTNISMYFSDDPKEFEYGPATIPPRFNRNHIFWPQSNKEDIQRAYGKDWLVHDAKTICAKMNTKAIVGKVNLTKNWVEGAYAQAELQLCLPMCLFYDMPYYGMRLGYTAREYAAVILHEVGHAFTYFEFMDRTLTTNQVLSGISRGLTEKDPRQKQAIFTTAKDVMKMDAKQSLALDKVENDKEASAILLACAIDRSVSELGGSIYDTVSCEQVADQYALRCGAGRHLVIALDKLPQIDRANGFTFVALGTMILAFSFVSTAYLMLLLLYVAIGAMEIGLASKEANYDNGPSRITRIKHQLVEKLKTVKLSEEAKKDVISDIEEIEKMAANHSDEMHWFEKAAYLLRPSFRKAHDYEILQKELEQLASNELFVKAAKLSTLHPQ